MIIAALARLVPRAFCSLLVSLVLIGLLQYTSAYF